MVSDKGLPVAECPATLPHVAALHDFELTLAPTLKEFFCNDLLLEGSDIHFAHVQGILRFVAHLFQHQQKGNNNNNNSKRHLM